MMSHINDMTSWIINFSVTFGISKEYNLSLDLYRIVLFAHYKGYYVHVVALK